MLRLLRLHLTDFRSYPTLTWRPARRVAVVTGPNGSGKTNLLEAVSLLVPGRGLRGARISELRRLEPAQPTSRAAWGVAGRVACGTEERDLATGSSPDGTPDRRVFRLDGVPPRNQAEMTGLFSTVWLTPQMDRLFQEGASGRRRFLDRLTWALEPGHAREVSAYETAMTGRNRLLAQGDADRDWLAGLEDSMVRHAVAATAARVTLVDRLNQALADGAAGAFPAPCMALLCPLADRLRACPAVEVEDWFRAELARCRNRDRAAGSAGGGAHRTDMALSDRESGLPAALASTGQQKAMLLGVVLGHAALIAQARGAAPLLLLDEPMVHLDASRRAALIATLLDLSVQAVLTGTDADHFAALRGQAEGLHTAGHRLHPDPSFPTIEPVN